MTRRILRWASLRHIGCYSAGVSLKSNGLVLLLLLLGAGHLGAQEVPAPRPREVAILKRYPALDFPTLAGSTSGTREFEGALGRSRNSGVPAVLLDEFIIMRAVKNADGEVIRAVLPALRNSLAAFDPSLTFFEDIQGKAQLVQDMENFLRRETVQPGALKALATSVKLKEKARILKRDLLEVDSFITLVALRQGLAKGAPIPESAWRAEAAAGSRLATTGADVFGNRFGPQVADRPPAIPLESYQQLRGAVPDSFWAPFTVPR